MAKSKSKKEPASAASAAHYASTEASPAAIPWPPLPTPSQRSSPLELDSVLPSQILLLHGFFPAKACANWLAFLSDAKHIPLEPSPAAKRGEAARTNHRFSVMDPDFAEALWAQTGLKDAVLDHRSEDIFESSEKTGARPVGLNPNIRIYRYEPGQAFAPHYDDTVRVGTRHTEWTLLVYLSGEEDGVQGGETAFYPCGVAPPSDSSSGKGRKERKIRVGEEDVVVQLRKGMALLHRHGRECLLHEGRPVYKGVKWVLRSDLVLA